jgi:hypothetical protein
MDLLRVGMLILVVLFQATSCANPQERPKEPDENLRQLFGTAVSGIPSLAAVHRITDSKSPERVHLLILIANAPYAASENRDAAIDDLAKIGSADAFEGIAELLAPHQAVGVRLRAAKALRNPGCSEGCLTAALFYLYRLSAGEQALGDQVFHESTRRSIEEDQQQVLSELNEVLTKHQSDVLKILTFTYGLGSPAPSPFSLEIVEKLHLSQGCDLLLKSEDYEQRWSRFRKTDPERTRKAIEKLGCRRSG